jgi:serine/threonine protein kinase
MNYTQTHLEFKQLLQSGGFASVALYQEKREPFGLVAVKQMNIDTENFIGMTKAQKEDNIRKTLACEHIIGKMLHHPNIIKTHNVDMDNFILYLEYCEGTDLLEYLKNSHPKAIVPCFDQVLSAVAYMHELGIGHRDIKLENIMLNTELKKIKLIDFGHSKALFDGNGVRSQFRGICGTLEYIPPEVIGNEFYDGEKHDIWCCGVVFYNLIYDKMPWEIANPYQDKRFNRFHHFMSRSELAPEIFPDLKKLGFNKSDEAIIQEMFLAMFALDPFERKSIREIEKMFSRMSFAPAVND